MTPCWPSYAFFRQREFRIPVLRHSILIVLMRMESLNTLTNSVPHFPPNFRGVACWVAPLPRYQCEEMKYWIFHSSSGASTPNLLKLRDTCHTQFWLRGRSRRWKLVYNKLYTFESGERSVLTQGSLCLPCSVRDTAWSWFNFFIYIHLNIQFLEYDSYFMLI